MSVSKKYNKWTSKYQERGPVYRIVGLYCKIDIDIICFLCYIISAVRKTVCGLVAQLDRVFDYESKGRGFESRRAHQKKQSKGCFFFCDFGAKSVLYGIVLHHIMHIFRFYSRQLLCSETTLGKLFPTISDKFDSYKTVIWVPKTVKNS